MPHTCCGVSRADSGALGTSEAERVMAMRSLLGTCEWYHLSPQERGEWEEAACSRPLSRDFLEAGDQLVHGLVHRDLLADHAVHRLGPDVLVVEDGELPVLGEIERRGAALELVVDRLAMPVGLPERALLARLGHREPAAESALDIGTDVLLLKQEADELLALRLVLGAGED